MIMEKLILKISLEKSPGDSYFCVISMGKIIHVHSWPILQSQIGSEKQSTEFILGNGISDAEILNSQQRKG